MFSEETDDLKIFFTYFELNTIVREKLQTCSDAGHAANTKESFPGSPTADHDPTHPPLLWMLIQVSSSLRSKFRRGQK